MPFCSVIIPTHNRATWLQESVASVLNQTFRDIELIIVDDGSSDNTAEVLSPYIKNYSLRCLVQKNRGVSAARNAGIAASSGQWLAFLDSDDYWLPGKLEKQIDYLKQKRELKICQTQEIWVRRGVRVNPMKRHQKYGGWIFEKCLPLCIVSPSAVMIERDVFDRVGLFDESFPVCEDYELWLRIANLYEIGLLDEQLIVKRGGHDDQLSRRLPVMDTFRIRAMEKILMQDLTDFQEQAVLRELTEKCTIVARGAFKRGRFLTALKYWKQSRKYGAKTGP